MESISQDRNSRSDKGVLQDYNSSVSCATVYSGGTSYRDLRNVCATWLSVLATSSSACAVSCAPSAPAAFTSLMS